MSQSGGRTRTMAFLILVLFMGVGVAHAQLLGSTPTAELDVAPAVEWMTLLYERIQAERISAPAASRMYAYAGITLYEAVVPGIDGNRSLSGQIPHMPDMPLPEEHLVYDWLSTANGALAVVIEWLFPDLSQETLAAIADLREQQAVGRQEAVDQEVVERSLEYGERLGNALVDWGRDDNFAETMGLEYELPAGDPMLWVLTSEGAPVEPYWGSIRPFALEYADACAIWLDMPFDTDPDSTFYKQALEVKEVGDDLTDEQAETARYWLDAPAQTGTPAGHWLSIENQLVDQLHLTLDRVAEMYALTGIALGDSFISTWSLKYQINLLRPETYIREHITRNWAPYIQTPLFPEYPSGHSTVSAAAAEVLTRLFGTVAFTDRTHILFKHEPLQRTYTSFEAAAGEAAISRLYGGIHYRVAIENGIDQGRCIANSIFSQIRLNPVRQPD